MAMDRNRHVSELLALLLSLVLASLTSATEHVATYSIRGMSGTVSFTKVPNTMDVQIRIGTLAGLAEGQGYEWSIRSLPMLYDRADPCSDENVGPVFRNLSNSLGLLSNFSGAVFRTNSLRLGGMDSVSGRTLLIELDETRYCASILPVGEVITAVAQFGTPFGGTVTFRQRVADAESETSIYVDLFDVRDPIEAQEYDWHLSDNSGINQNMTVEEWCIATAASPYDHVGDLTSKFGSVIVKTVHTRERYFFIDTNITLSGPNSILDKSLVFNLTAGSKAACSPVRLLKPKKVRADFNNNNVTGSIVFSQASPWEATLIEVDLFNLRSMAGGYHVHKFPVLQRILLSDFVGSGDFVSGHFNPYNIDTTSDPDFPNGTNDQYELGDISGKFGSLAGLASFSNNFTDWNMPLYGKNSIVGRSVIIHEANSARWVYGRIGYPTPVKTVTAVLTYPLVGQITFRQDVGDPFSDTSVFLDLAHADGSETTENHDWHIHIAEIGDDHLDQTGRCSSTRGHFNPFNVELTEEYATECSVNDTRRCEVGDFSKKYGRITVPGSVRTQVGKYFFTDVQLPLSGVYSVADRSVVVHEKDGQPERLGCGNTLDVVQAQATANIWNDVPINGSVSLYQESEYDPVFITADLSGLDGVTGPWHVHVLPVPYADNYPCSGTSVQGHYNPFEAMESPAVATLDYYELGDLSGKFGFWNTLQEVNISEVDASVSLFGPRSLIGRSIVIHLSADGSRFRCATLNPQLGEGDFRIEARADITSNTFSGYMIFGQTHHSNGRMSDTTIEAFFDPSASSEEDVYQWTIRAGDLSSGQCERRNAVFNPNTVATDGAYATQCSIASQLRCQVGDLTSKIGNYSSYFGRALLTDTNLPLTGTAGVIGRPLYLQSWKNEAVGCAIVTPLSSTGVQTALRFQQMIDFDRYAFKQEIAAVLADVEPWQIIAPYDPVLLEDYDRCTELKLWIIGENANAAKAELEDKAENDDLGIYSPTNRCRIGTGAAIQNVPMSSALALCFAVMMCLWQQLS